MKCFFKKLLLAVVFIPVLFALTACGTAETLSVTVVSLEGQSADWRYSN